VAIVEQFGDWVIKDNFISLGFCIECKCGGVGGSILFNHIGVEAKSIKSECAAFNKGTIRLL